MSESRRTVCLSILLTQETRRQLDNFLFYRICLCIGNSSFSFSYYKMQHCFFIDWSVACCAKCNFKSQTDLICLIEFDLIDLTMTKREFDRLAASNWVNKPISNKLKSINAFLLKINWMAAPVELNMNAFIWRFAQNIFLSNIQFQKWVIKI